MYSSYLILRTIHHGERDKPRPLYLPTTDVADQHHIDIEIPNSVSFSVWMIQYDGGGGGDDDDDWCCIIVWLYLLLWIFPSIALTATIHAQLNIQSTPDSSTAHILAHALAFKHHRTCIHRHEFTYSYILIYFYPILLPPLIFTVCVVGK